jgi:hypothetical protein
MMRNLVEPLPILNIMRFSDKHSYIFRPCFSSNFGLIKTSKVAEL